MSFLEMRNITKRFPGVLANDDVSFSVEEREVHALLGENGAGKTTLMNILYGLYEQDEGTIFLDGKEICNKDPRHALEAGIGMVHQHFMLIPALTVIENIVLGMKENKALLDLNKAAREVKKLAARYKMEIDPFAYVWQLSVGQQQRLEIIKSLYRGARLLILDEPTAILTPQEVSELFVMLDHLTKVEGYTIIFITHKLAEVMQICTRCTVLRRGRFEATVDVCDITEKEELARLMVGRSVSLKTELPPANFGDTMMKVDNINALGDRGLPALEDVSFTLREGEILGVAGVDGNGQSELVECLTGLREVTSGSIYIDNVETTGFKVKDILKHRVSHIPEDRHKRGIAKGMSIKENLIMMGYDKPPFSKYGFLDLKWIAQHAEQLCQEYDVKTPGIEELSGKLSGGNQQKFVVGREIDREPRLLIAMHPSRGLDVGAAKDIRARIVKEREKGTGVLLVSTDLDEVLQLSDRIMVMYEGRIMGILDRDEEITRESIGLLMGGESR